jgi:uncharacterized protein YbcV (DUF1398 family)
MRIVYLFLLIIFFLYADSNINYYLHNKQKIYLKKIDSNSTKTQKQTQVTFYKKENGELIGLKNQFFIKLKTDNISTLIKKYNLKLIKSYSSNLYLVETKNSDILKTVNTIHQDKNTTYAYPNFLRTVEQR